jgi:hypothetical protein
VCRGWHSRMYDGNDCVAHAAYYQWLTAILGSDFTAKSSLAGRSTAGRKTLWQVFDLNVRPFLLEVFGDQAAVTVFGCFFAAEQAGAVEQILGEFLLDDSRLQQRQEQLFVVCPRALFLFIGVEHFLRGGQQVWFMTVVDVADSLAEVTQVFFFCETGKLRDIVEPHIEEAFYAGIGETGEKSFGRFFGEADGENAHGTKKRRR